MEECAFNNKRLRLDDDDLLSDSPNFKIIRVESDKSADLEQKSADADSPLELTEAKEIPDDLLNILEDTENGTDNIDSTIQELESVIKSLEEEIQVAAPVHSGESQRDNGYLLEASDNSIGLPPTGGFVEEGKVEAFHFAAISGSVGLEEMLGFEDEIRSYDMSDISLGVCVSN